MKSQAIVAYWALPEEADGKAYRAVIDTLAAAQNGTRFDPHISLGSLDSYDADIDDVVAALRDLKVQPSGVGRSGVFTKSLYIDLSPDARLERARACLSSRAGFRSTRKFEPHISLCYGPPVDEAAMTPAIQALLSQPVRIDRVRAVAVELPVETYADVASWSPIATFQI